MKVEIWSDVVCPWCYIGKRRFEAALAPVRAPPTRSRSTWRASSSTPTRPRGARDARRVPGPQVRRGAGPGRGQLNDRIVALAAAEGLDFRFETLGRSTRSTPTGSLHLAAARAGGCRPGAVPSRRTRRGEVLGDPDALGPAGRRGRRPEPTRRRVLARTRTPTRSGGHREARASASTASRSSSSTGLRGVRRPAGGAVPRGPPGGAARRRGRGRRPQTDPAPLRRPSASSPSSGSAAGAPSSPTSGSASARTSMNCDSRKPV